MEHIVFFNGWEAEITVNTELNRNNENVLRVFIESKNREDRNRDSNTVIKTVCLTDRRDIMHRSLENIVKNYLSSNCGINFTARSNKVSNITSIK